jgi:hypothetical protein
MVFNGQCLIAIGGKQFALSDMSGLALDPSEPFVQWIWVLFR